MAKEQTLLAVQDVLAGMSTAAAAAKHGIDRTTISRYLKRNNITKPPKVKEVQSDSAAIQKHPRRSSNNINIALLSELILEQKSVDEIAHRMQIPAKVLGEYIRDHGIQAHRAKRIVADLSYKSEGYWVMGHWVAGNWVTERLIE
jgi:IS30 family transposase